MSRPARCMYGTYKGYGGTLDWAAARLLGLVVATCRPSLLVHLQKGDGLNLHRIRTAIAHHDRSRALGARPFLESVVVR